MLSFSTICRAFFSLSPSTTTVKIETWSFLSWANFSNRIISSLQASHHVPQKNRTTGLPLHAERVVEPPSSLFRVKGGASFFAGNFWTPNEGHEGQSEGDGGAAPQRKETDAMKKEADQKTVSKRHKAFFMTLLRRVGDTIPSI